MKVFFPHALKSDHVLTKSKRDQLLPSRVPRIFLSSACLPYVLRYLTISEAHRLSLSCRETERVLRNFQDFWAHRVFSLFTSPLNPFLQFYDLQSPCKDGNYFNFIEPLCHEMQIADLLHETTSSHFIPSLLENMHSLQISALSDLLIQKTKCESILLETGFHQEIAQEVDEFFRSPCLPPPILLNQSYFLEGTSNSIFREYLIHFEQTQEKSQESKQILLSDYCARRCAIHCQFVSMCLKHQKYREQVLQEYHKYVSSVKLSTSVLMIIEEFKLEDPLAKLKKFAQIWRIEVIEKLAPQLHQAILDVISRERLEGCNETIQEWIQVVLQSDLETCLDQHSIILQSHAHLDLQETCLIAFGTDFASTTLNYYSKIAEHEPLQTLITAVSSDVDNCEQFLPVQLRYQFIQQAVSFLRSKLNQRITSFQTSPNSCTLGNFQKKELETRLKYLKLEKFVPFVKNEEFCTQILVDLTGCLVKFCQKLESLDYTSSRAEKKWKKCY